MALVVDASVMLSWYFEDEENPSDRVLKMLASEQLIVPSHWQAELANGIVVAERRGRVQVSRISRLFDLLDILDIEVDHDGASNALARILPLSRAHNLTVYDTLYLEVAQRRGSPLATLDQDLAGAGKSIGLKVIEA